MASVVITLFEAEQYEAGAAALLNSLFWSGYRGHVWCGVRGTVPPWLTPSEVERSVGTAVKVFVVNVAIDGHLPMYKAHLMSDVARQEPTATSFIYFDADVVVKCRWAFVERWCARGVAAVADESWYMPATSPVRGEWAELRERLGVVSVPSEPAGPLDLYCNAGFVGVSRDCMPFVDLWRRLVDAAQATGTEEVAALLDGPRSQPWFLDQELFNIALMGWGQRAQLMGPEAMDFASGGDVFSHATGTPKPWQRHFIRSALVGRPPSKRDREHWRYRGGPFRPSSRTSLRWKVVTYKAGRAMGAMARRRDF